MTFAIVTVLPEPVTPRRVVCRSPLRSALSNPADAPGWSPARPQGSTNRNGAFAAGRSRGTCRVSPWGIFAFILEQTFWYHRAPRTGSHCRASTPVRLPFTCYRLLQFAPSRPVEEGKSGRSFASPCPARAHRGDAVRTRRRGGDLLLCPDAEIGSPGPDPDHTGRCRRTC